MNFSVSSTPINPTAGNPYKAVYPSVFAVYSVDFQKEVSVNKCRIVLHNSLSLKLLRYFLLCRLFARIVLLLYLCNRIGYTMQIYNIAVQQTNFCYTKSEKYFLKPSKIVLYGCKRKT